MDKVTVSETKQEKQPPVAPSADAAAPASTAPAPSKGAEKISTNRSRLSGVDLRNASFCGRLAEAKQLLEKGANPNAAREDSGATPLFQAVRNGHFDMVKLLVDKGATVDLADKAGTLPRDLASTNGFHDIVRFLDVIQMLKVQNADAN